MMDKLLPCPFCGGEVSIALCGDGFDAWWFITRGHGENACKCRLFMESEKFNKDSEMADFVADDLIAAWNRRTGKDTNVTTNNAVPVVRGEWVVDECDTTDDVPSSSWIDFHCSECNTDYGLEEGQYGWCRYEKIPYQYCPNCGAKIESKSST